MIDLQRKKLSGHKSRAGVQARGLFLILIFGLPFLGFGILVMLLAGGVIGEKASEIQEAPEFIPVAVGGLLAFVGLCMTVYGASLEIKAVTRILRERKCPDEQWFLDYPWNPEGIREGVFYKAIWSVLFMIGFSVFLLPFNWWAFFAPEGTSGIIVPVLVVLFDLICLASWYFTIVFILKGVKYGGSRIRFSSFPFFVGENIDVFFEKAGRLKKFDKLEVILRYIEEEITVRGAGRSQRREMASYSVYEDKRTLTPEMSLEGEDSEIRRVPAAAGSSSQEELHIVLPIPRGSYGNALSESPPSYWELEIKAEMPGLDYSSAFLLPVYQKSLF